MNALWSFHPATARDVERRLPEDTRWAYTTIKTMLSRLVGKGAISEHKRANTSVYEPLVCRGEAQRSALRRLLDHAFGGALEPMVHFMVNDGSMSDKQRRELVALLEEKGRGGGEDR
jgi:predicted transcriptional regulator